MTSIGTSQFPSWLEQRTDISLFNQSDEGSESGSEGRRSGRSSVAESKKETPGTGLSIHDSYISPKTRYVEGAATGLSGNDTGLTTATAAIIHERWAVTSNGMSRYRSERKGAESTLLQSSYQENQPPPTSAKVSFRPPYNRTTQAYELHRRSSLTLSRNGNASRCETFRQKTTPEQYESMWRPPSLPKRTVAESAAEEIGGIETSRSTVSGPETFERALNEAMRKDITPLSPDELDQYRVSSIPPISQLRRTTAAKEVSGFTWGPGQRAENSAGHSTHFRASAESDPEWLDKLWNQDRESLVESSDAKSTSPL